MSFEASVAANQKSMLWTPPDFFDATNLVHQARMDELVNTYGYKYAPKYVELANDIAELRYPNAADEVDRQRVREEILKMALNYGQWFADHNTRDITQIAPDEDTHFRLLTERNAYLRTRPEQRQLYYDATILTLGQSVGSVCVDSAVRSGLGRRHLLVDPDILSFMNMNRVQRKLSEVGMAKTTATANNIVQINPFVDIHLFDGGATQETLKRIFEVYVLSVVVEAMDSIHYKLIARLWAQQTKTALIMPTDVGYGATICVERYDIEDDVVPFLGRLTDSQLEALKQTIEVIGDLKADYALGIIGLDTLTARMLASLIEFERTLSGFSQLGITAQLAGSGAVNAIQRIILGHSLPSGEYRVDDLIRMNDALV